jgi:plasmid stabilization system protein ParE
MSYTYKLHPLAVEDYSEAYASYEDKQSGLGERFIKAVRFKIDEIIEHPENYGSRDNKEYRETKVDYFPFLIVYKIHKRKKLIHISSIHNMKKHPRKKYRK